MKIIRENYLSSSMMLCDENESSSKLILVRRGTGILLFVEIILRSSKSVSKKLLPFVKNNETSRERFVLLSIVIFYCSQDTYIYEDKMRRKFFFINRRMKDYYVRHLSYINYFWLCSMALKLRQSSIVSANVSPTLILSDNWFITFSASINFFIVISLVEFIETILIARL